MQICSVEKSGRRATSVLIVTWNASIRNRGLRALWRAREATVRRLTAQHPFRMVGRIHYKNKKAATYLSCRHRGWKNCTS